MPDGKCPSRKWALVWLGLLTQFLALPTRAEGAAYTLVWEMASHPDMGNVLFHLRDTECNAQLLTFAGHLRTWVLNDMDPIDIAMGLPKTLPPVLRRPLFALSASELPEALQQVAPNLQILEQISTGSVKLGEAARWARLAQRAPDFVDLLMKSYCCRSEGTGPRQGSYFCQTCGSLLNAMEFLARVLPCDGLFDTAALAAEAHPSAPLPAPRLPAVGPPRFACHPHCDEPTSAATLAAAAAHDARDYLYAVYSGRARTIHVAFLPHLDGGGSWFGQDYKRWLPRHIGSSFGTAFELCAGPAFIGYAEFSQQGL
jgi:hypothetical protein